MPDVSPKQCVGRFVSHFFSDLTKETSQTCLILVWFRCNGQFKETIQDRILWNQYIYIYYNYIIYTIYIYHIYIYTAVFDVYMYIRYITILWYYLKHFGILGELNTWAILGKPPQSAVSSASPVQVPSSLALTVWVPECISRGTPQNRPRTVGTHPLLNYP